MDIMTSMLIFNIVLLLAGCVQMGDGKSRSKYNEFNRAGKTLRHFARKIIKGSAVKKIVILKMIIWTEFI